MKYEFKDKYISYILKQVTLKDKNDIEDWYNLLSKLEFECISQYIGNPKRIVDIGCGLGRMSIYINSQLTTSPEFILLDSTSFNKPTYGFNKNNEGIFYNNLDLTKEFCNLNGLNNIQIIDVEEEDISCIKHIDLVISFLSAGFHYPIENYLIKLIPNMSPNGTFIFGIRKDRKRYYSYNPREFKGGFKEVFVVESDNTPENYLIIKL